MGVSMGQNAASLWETSLLGSQPLGVGQHSAKYTLIKEPGRHMSLQILFIVHIIE